MQGGSGADVLNGGVEIFVLLALGVLIDVAAELGAEVRDAIHLHLRQIGTLVVHLVHRRQGRYISIVLAATTHKEGQRGEA